MTADRPSLAVDDLDVIAPGAFAAAVAPLFEGARGFLGRLTMARPFGTVDAMFARAREIAHTMPLDERLELDRRAPAPRRATGDGLRAVACRAGLRRPDTDDRGRGRGGDRAAGGPTRGR